MKRGLYGSELKWIALLSMLVDHFGVVFYTGSVVARRPLFSLSVYYALRCVGRPAFPLYAFLLAEGLRYTRSVKNYLLRLFCFGLISEIPFDLAFCSGCFDWSYQNVFFTLFLGLLAVALWQRITGGEPERCGAARVLAGLLCLAAAAFAADKLHTDYGAWGVLVIVSLCLFRELPWMRDLLTGCFLLGASALEAAAFPDFLLFRLYNGRRGRQRKYLFYVFYPAHLLLLSLLCRALYGG